MDDRVAGSFAQLRATMLLLSITAALATILAAIAIYGSIWYSVTQRIPEIGLRVALGASRASICIRVLGRAFRLTAMGGAGASRSVEEGAKGIVWAALLAACCPLIKVAGWVWAPILLMGWIVAIAPKLGRKLVITAFAVSAAALLVLARTKVALAGYTLHLDFAHVCMGSSQRAFDTLGVSFAVVIRFGSP
jgi:ABC-type antimicrobial peptide transport system permease subunit